MVFLQVWEQMHKHTTVNKCERFLIWWKCNLIFIHGPRGSWTRAVWEFRHCVEGRAYMFPHPWVHGLYNEIVGCFSKYEWGDPKCSVIRGPWVHYSRSVSNVLYISRCPSFLAPNVRKFFSIQHSGGKSPIPSVHGSMDPLVKGAQISSTGPWVQG